MGFIAPWMRVGRASDIPVADLVSSNVRLVIMDRDNTAVPYGSEEIDPSVRAWIGEARDAGLAVAIVTNNWYAELVGDTARDLGVRFIGSAMKPLPFALWRICLTEGVPPEQAVLIGDQVYTDLLAGRLAGIRTILVDPLVDGDLPHTRVLRKLDGMLLKGE